MDMEDGTYDRHLNRTPNYSFTSFLLSRQVEIFCDSVLQ